MVRQNQKLINFIQTLMDTFIIICNILASSFLHWLFKGNIKFHFSTSDIILIFVFIVGVHLIFYNIVNIYTSRRTSSFTNELVDLIKAGLFSYIFIALVAFILNILTNLQIILLAFFILNTVSIIIFRFVLRKLLRSVRSKGYNQKYMLILGENACTKSFIQKITSNLNLGYNIVGIFNDTKPQENKDSISYIGKITDFEKFISKSLIDEVIIMFENDETENIKFSVNICEKWGVKFTIVPSVFSILPNRLYVDNFDGLPVLNVRQVPLDNILNSFIKRLLDIIFASIILIILSPLMSIICLIIKTSSKGPIIFKQNRVGINRKTFDMYKFRSMAVGSEKTKKMTINMDDRCTSFGRFLRKYSIDELPQLINVIKGDMSLVGPRPEIPHFVDDFQESIPLYMVKHYVKPGMSGWAQVNGLRGNTSISERIKYDIFYIENWSIWFDMKILFLTATKGIFNKNAY